MTEAQGAVIVAHMFPNQARPFSGPLIANQVGLLAREFPLQVVAPVRRVPPLPRWRKERRAACATLDRGVLVRRPKVLAVPFGGLSFETALWPRALGRDVREAARAVDAGLVHAHFGIPDGVAGSVLATQLRLPFLLTLHGSDALLYPRRRNLRGLLRRAVESATRVFAISTAIAEVAADLGAEESRITLTPGGIPDDWGGTSPGEARERLKLDMSPLVLWVGRFVPVKQPEVAIRAFAGIGRGGARLVMVGDGPLRPRAERLVRQLALGDRVTFLGALPPRVIELYEAAASVILNSSSSEGLSLTICEGLACGTPAVAFPVGGIPDVLGREGKYGTLAATRSVKALATALASELETSRSPEALRAAASRFRLSETLKPVLATYRGLLAA